MSLVSKIQGLADGYRTSIEIAAQVGCSAKYVQNVMRKNNMPRLPRGSLTGPRQRDWKGGYQIAHDGYLLMMLPEHPNARKVGYILAHRVIAEIYHGRLLDPREVVDHVNGLTLDNRSENLRVYSSNAEHLRATLTGKIPKWSEAGYAAMLGPRTGLERIDSYRPRRKSGEVRELQIRQLHELHDTGAQSLLRKELRTLLERGCRHPLLTIPEFLYVDP